MLPDQVNPQPDESPRNSVQTFGGLVPGLVSIAATLALAILVARTKKNNEDSLPDTIASNVEANAGAQVRVAKNPDATKKSKPASPLIVVLNPSTQPQPFPIDIKPNHIDYGGLIIGVFSLFVTIFIAVLAYRINASQATSAQAQATAAQAQAAAAQAQATAADDDVNIKFIEEFRQRIDDLLLPTDDSKQPDYDQNFMRKSLAIIALAQYGERALPVLKMALEASDPRLRDSAVNVLAQMLANQENKSRDKVFLALLQYFDKGDVSMRVEILRCFVKVFRRLSDAEAQCAKDTFRSHIFPDADLSKSVDDQMLLIEAAKFFGSWPSCDSKEFLLAIAKNPYCGDGPRVQARDSLRDFAKVTCDLAPELQEQINAVPEIKK